MRSLISKKMFLDALPCRTMGWYAHHHEGESREPTSPADLWQFYCGNQVGETAREQLGPGLMLSRSGETTQQMIVKPATELLFEARFETGPFVARADAIRRAGERWDVIEVKSAKEPDEGARIDRKHVDDLAYTVMVARGCGLEINRCMLMFLSRAFRFDVRGDLLVDVDVTDRVLPRADEFAALAMDVSSAILGELRPDPDLKLACRKCAYFASHCVGRGVATSIFVIPGLSQKRLDRIKPIVDFHQLQDDVDLTDIQRGVFDMVRSGEARVMPGLGRLEDVVWPAYYLDFETISPVLPWFPGDGVYAQRPFQYSIHACDAIGKVTSHVEYLAPAIGDWRRELAERLLDALGTDGSIIIYTSFEEKELRCLGGLFPDLASRVDAVLARLFDLNDVIKKGYDHPGFEGSTSIKKVLPVMVPDLRYDGMAIGEGMAASGAFGLMRVGEFDPESFDGWRRDLLEYCKLDTMAMVRVHEALDRVWSASRT